MVCAACRARPEKRLLHAVGDGTSAAGGEKFDLRRETASKVPPLRGGDANMMKRYPVRGFQERPRSSCVRLVGNLLHFCRIVHDAVLMVAVESELADVRPEKASSSSFSDGSGRNE